jgi:mono/diheme cytochrome c family protein
MKQLTSCRLLALFVLAAALPSTACAEDVSTLYKSKCAVCHAPDGSGRKAMSGTNLLAESARKRSDNELAEAIAKGGPRNNDAHAYEKKGISADQVKLLVGYIRELQKKTR